MSKVCGGKLAHIRARHFKIKLFDPVLVYRILIPYMGSHLEIGIFLFHIPVFQIILRNLGILDEDIIIEAVISMKNRHKA